MPQLPPILFDLETDGLLNDLTTVHCWAAQEPDGSSSISGTPGSLSTLLPLLKSRIRIAHNGIGFDDQAIAKITGEILDPGMVRDTLVMSRLAWPDLKHRDLANLRKRARPYGIPRHLIGRHSLEAWGYRLHEAKGEYDGGWESYNSEMLAYCKQDVVVLRKLWELLQTKELTTQSVILEHQFQHEIVAMMDVGVRYDQDSADELEKTLVIRRAEIDSELSRMVRPFVDMRLTPKRKEIRWKMTLFNAGSPAHRVRHFKENYGWKPNEFTKTGGVKMDSEVLESLTYPEAAALSERAKITKILGYLGTGKLPWRDCVEEDGRIRGFVNHLGTVTSRCSHSRPNLGNIPKTGELGQACRALFLPREGWDMVGVDASGLELRALANRLCPYDGGAYADVILSGDIHTANQKAAGLDTRDQAKTFIYAWLYGAGSEKIGSIVGKGASAGKALKSRFLKNTPGVGEWIEDVKAQAKSGYVVALDGRRVPIPTRKDDETGEWKLLEYVAPNYQLQADGAVIMKLSTVLANRAVRDLGIRARLMLSVHDELQFECHPDDTGRLVGALPTCITRAGQELGVLVPLDGEAKYGRNWKETH